MEPTRPNRRTTTYLEMTSPDRLVPSDPAPGLELRRVDRTSPLVIEVSAGVGAQYGWRRSRRSPEEWAEWLAHPHREYWLIRHHDQAVGIGDLEPQPGGDVEVTTFGLLPEHVGKGLGGYALTLLLRQAWRTTPIGADKIHRVWLHTSSSDHPNALPNYRRRGLRPYEVKIWSPDGTATVEKL